MYNAELFCGQYYIYTLQLLEYLLEEAGEALAQTAGANRGEWLKFLQKTLEKEEEIVPGSIVVVQPGDHFFSGQKFAEQMGLKNANQLRRDFLKLPNGESNGYLYPGLGPLFAPEEIRVGQKNIVPRLGGIVEYSARRSGFFDGRGVLFYVFFQWHCLPFEYVQKLKGVLPGSEYDGLVSITGRLRDIRISPPLLPDVVELARRYFDLYGRIISNREAVETLFAYRRSLSKGMEHAIAPIEHKLIGDVLRTLSCFYTFEEPAEQEAAACRSTAKLTLYEFPQCGSAQEDAGTRGDEWDAAVRELLGEEYHHRAVTDRIRDAVRELDSECYNRDDWAQLTSKLDAANVTDRSGRYESDIWRYENRVAASAVETAGGTLILPYRKIIDAMPGDLPGADRFDFSDTGEPLRYDACRALFEPELQNLRNRAQQRAAAAGHPEGPEEKACVTSAAALPAEGGPRYRLTLRFIDYFSGLALRELFQQTLAPDEKNIRGSVIPLLLCKGRLAAFAGGEEAEALQERFDVAGTYDPAGPELVRRVREAIFSLYENLVPPDESGPGALAINTAVFAGCGLFILTGDRCGSAHRPMLLLEKRWRVSEKTGDLCYPSAGSCNYFTAPAYANPAQYRRLCENPAAFAAYAPLLPREANPFETARRELFEELFLPVKTEELHLISFGVDEDRLLHQFSFLYEAEETAEEILQRADYASASEEGRTFAVPFSRRVLGLLLENYVFEPGASYALGRLMVLKADLLWENTGNGGQTEQGRTQDVRDGNK